MSKFLSLGALAGILMISPALADDLALGRAATQAEIAAWDIDIRPDGLGLPEGKGSVLEGEPIYAEKCAACHGDFGEAVGRWPVLAGGFGTLTSDRPVKTIGSYWPYLSTVWDYVHRAMPFGDAQSLGDDEVYSLTAYLLYLNDLVDEDFELSKANFAEIKLPNEESFYDDDRSASAVFSKRDRCMSGCKESVEITTRAAMLDVTPADAEARKAKAAAHEAQSNLNGASVGGVSESTVIAAITSSFQDSLDPALVDAGEKVFKQCKACHQVGEGAKNKVGPHLTALFDRPAGGVEGFRYSKAMMTAGSAGMVWDEDTLKAFLASPKQVVPKTKMNFRGLKDPTDIAAVLAYLRATGSDD